MSHEEVVTTALRQQASSLKGFVRTRVPADEADDVFQAAAMRAVEKAASLGDPDRVVPWLYRLFRNVVIDAARRRASRRRLFDDAAPASEPATPTPDEACGCSVTQSQQIAANYAAILELVDIRGVSIGEAAGSLGISINNATVRLHRARRALKKRMREHCGVNSPEDCLDCRCVYDGCCAA